MDAMFEVLGGVRAIGHGGPIELQPQVRRLLGILLADRGAPCRWSESSTGSG